MKQTNYKLYKLKNIEKGQNEKIFQFKYEIEQLCTLYKNFKKKI